MTIRYPVRDPSGRLVATHAAPSDATARFLSALDGVRRNGVGWMARCPAHDDRTASLAVTNGNDGRCLAHCHAGCSLEAVLAAMRLAPGDLFAQPRPGTPPRARRRIVATYDYADAAGKLAYQVVRYAPKDFRQRRPDGDGWSWSLAGVERVPYRLSELLAAPADAVVYIPEGERDVDILAAAGAVATCNPGGAGKWPATFAPHLAGRTVVILPDNDAPGRKHAEQVRACLAPVAASVRVLELPDLPDGGDVSDWLAAGGTVEQLAEMTRLESSEPEHAWPEPEDRGSATLSELGAVEYVEDLIRPGRIVVVAAEEGTGKSYAIAGELAIRVATAGGSFAGTWPVLRQGPVLVLSEMHADDDYTREAAILDALELERDALAGKYYRLPLASAAGDAPALQVPEWRAWITAWMRERGALLAVFDTATGAAQVDPWGGDIQAVYRGLRMMIEQYPELAIVLIVHLKKPQGRGERRISDVLGEWGRWCDVLLLLEREGETRVKLSARKRVRHERRIVAVKRDGLLVEPQDTTEGSGPKVPLEQVVAAVRAEPGLSIKVLAERLGVARGTARSYLDKVPDIVLIPGNRGSLTCHLSDGVNEGTDMSSHVGVGTDVSPVTPYIDRGVTDMSRPATSAEAEDELLEQLRLTDDAAS